MLDNESSDSKNAAVTAGAEASAPAPRRRRRAASRPAGPPVAVPESTPEPVAVDAVEDEEVSAEAPTPVSTGPVTPEPVTPEPVTPEPMTPEPATERVADASATEPVTSAGPVAEDTSETPTDVVAADPVFDSPFQSTASSTSRRRRASRSAVADPFAVPQIDVSGLRPPSSEDTDPEASDTKASDTRPSDTKASDTTADTGNTDAGNADAGKPAPRRRRRATRGQSAPVEAPPADDTAAADPAPSAEDEESQTAGSGVDPLAAALDQLAASKAAAPVDTESNDETDDSDSSDDSASSDDSEDDENSGSRRRRRRRGGRRRRRSSDGDDTEADSESGKASESEDKQSEDTSGEDNSDQSNDDEGSGRRRRRRRRRSGEDSDETARRRANDAVTGIDGSTRLEAKRQRRREGREAGRRRTPILSEAEFLARRESVKRTMVIRQRERLAQIAVLEDDVLVEHYVDHSSTRSLIGNVYLGRVQNVLPSMEAAFIDIGQGRNAVLYAGEIDWNAFDQGGRDRKIESVLKSGQTVLVQVTKDPIGAKGARLTHHVSLPGRYIVYSPGGHLSGISRKLPDTERKRLKQVLSEHIDDSASVIVRTAAEGASEDELVRDITRLKSQWDAIEKKIKNGGAPKALHTEPDPTVRIVRDLFTEDFSELIISGTGGSDDAYDNVTGYVEQVAPHLLDRVKRWDGDDVFVAHRVDEQIAKALERKVHLPSGGSLIIDRTEAMTVIDVNTGKFTGSGGNLEATVTSNNLEAAEEIVRQLRLRDIGGIIVIDFIDMVLPSNRDLLLRRLVECLGRDRTRHQVAEVTSLGLVQMTRKRIGTGLGEAFTTACEHCQGKGFISHVEPVETPAEDHQHNGNNSRRNRGGAKQSRSERSTKARAESAPTPPRQPLPKVMPPPPPGLAPVSHGDDSEESAEQQTSADQDQSSAGDTGEAITRVEAGDSGDQGGSTQQEQGESAKQDEWAKQDEEGASGVSGSEAAPADATAEPASGARKTAARKTTTRKSAASKTSTRKTTARKSTTKKAVAATAEEPTQSAEPEVGPTDTALADAEQSTPKRTRKTAAKSPRTRKRTSNQPDGSEPVADGPSAEGEARTETAPADDVAAALGALVATHTVENDD